MKTCQLVAAVACTACAVAWMFIDPAGATPFIAGAIVILAMD